jgi:spore coat protein U-like protein
MRAAPLKSLVVVAMAAAGMSAGTAHAANSTQNVQVTATVNSNCRVTAPSAVGFGIVDVNPAAATSVAAAGQVTVTCNKGAAVALTVDNGLHGTWNMLNGSNADVLAYTLKMPTNFTTCPAAGAGSNWTSVDMAPAFVTSGGAQSLAICGQVATPQLQTSPGSYTDTVVVTATY